MPGKVYGKIVIQRVGNEPEEIIGEEQGNFRHGSGCLDQTFALMSAK